MNESNAFSRLPKQNFLRVVKRKKSRSSQNSSRINVTIKQDHNRSEVDLSDGHPDFSVLNPSESLNHNNSYAFEKLPDRGFDEDVMFSNRSRNIGNFDIIKEVEEPVRPSVTDYVCKGIEIDGDNEMKEIQSIQNNRNSNLSYKNSNNASIKDCAEKEEEIEGKSGLLSTRNIFIFGSIVSCAVVMLLIRRRDK